MLILSFIGKIFFLQDGPLKKFAIILQCKKTRQFVYQYLFNINTQSYFQQRLPVNNEYYILRGNYTQI